MTEPRARKPIDKWLGEEIPAGESRNVMLAVSESYSSMTVQIPIHIRRATEDGPVVFVTAAVHGDEINGTGAVRELIRDADFRLLRGSVILVPVLNILAFESPNVRVNVRVLCTHARMYTRAHASSHEHTRICTSTPKKTTQKI